MKNPQAFPRPYSHDERPNGGYEGDRVETFQLQDGMTLRDYFAAKAMITLLDIDLPIKRDESIFAYFDTTAVRAYMIADAMLKERERER
jgi:hypothetical protein